MPLAFGRTRHLLCDLRLERSRRTAARLALLVTSAALMVLARVLLLSRSIVILGKSSPVELMHDSL